MARSLMLLRPPIFEEVDTFANSVDLLWNPPRKSHKYFDSSEDQATKYFVSKSSEVALTSRLLSELNKFQKELIEADRWTQFTRVPQGVLPKDLFVKCIESTFKDLSVSTAQVEQLLEHCACVDASQTPVKVNYILFVKNFPRIMRRHPQRGVRKPGGEEEHDDSDDSDLELSESTDLDMETVQIGEPQVLKALRLYDTAQCGFLKLGEVILAVSALKLQLSQIQLLVAEQMCSEHAQGKLDYAAWLHHFTVPDETLETLAALQRPDADGLRSLVTKFIANKFFYAYDAFKHFDTRQTGELDEKEFRRGLRSLLGPVASKGVLSDDMSIRGLLTQMFKRGPVRLRRFVETFGAPEKHLVDHVSDYLLAKFGNSHEDAFNYLRGGGARTLTLDRFSRHLRNLEFELSHEECKNLFLQAEITVATGKDRSLDYIDFDAFEELFLDHETKLKRLEGRIAILMMVKFGSVDEAFAFMNPSGRFEAVTLDQMQRAFEHLDPSIPPKQIRRVVQRVDTSEDGLVERYEFVELFALAASEKLKAVRKELSEIILSRFGTASDAFEFFDLHSKGLVSAEDLIVGFGALKRIRLSNEEMQGFVRGADKDKSGFLSFEEFYRLFNDEGEDMETAERTRSLDDQDGNMFENAMSELNEMSLSIRDSVHGDAEAMDLLDSPRRQSKSWRKDHAPARGSPRLEKVTCSWSNVPILADLTTLRQTLRAEIKLARDQGACGSSALRVLPQDVVLSVMNRVQLGLTPNQISNLLHQNTTPDGRIDCETLLRSFKMELDSESDSSDSDNSDHEGDAESGPATPRSTLPMRRRPVVVAAAATAVNRLKVLSGNTLSSQGPGSPSLSGKATGMETQTSQRSRSPRSSRDHVKAARIAFQAKRRDALLRRVRAAQHGPRSRSEAGSAMAELLLQSFSNLSAAYHAFDVNKMGQITVAQFITALKDPAININLSVSQVCHIFYGGTLTEAHISEDKVISPSLFLQTLRLHDPAASGMRVDPDVLASSGQIPGSSGSDHANLEPGSAGDGPPTSPRHGGQPLAAHTVGRRGFVSRQRLRELGSELMACKGTLSNAYRCYDPLNHGYITRTELQFHLAELGVSKDEAGAIVSEGDTKGRGCLTLADFRRVFSLHLALPRREPVPTTTATAPTAATEKPAEVTQIDSEKKTPMVEEQTN